MKRDRKLSVLIVLLLSIIFGACNVERTYYFVEGITIHEIPEFAQDANETNGEVNPDIFIELRDQANNIIWSSPYYSNVDSSEFPIHYELDNVLELNAEDYFLDLYDYDLLEQGTHDYLGGIVFYGRDITSTYYSQYNNSQLFGNLSITVDMLVDRE